MSAKNKSLVQPMSRAILSPKEHAGSTLYTGCTFAPAVFVKAGERLVVDGVHAWSEPGTSEAPIDAQQRIEQLEEQLAEEKARRVKEVNAAHMSVGTFDAMGELARQAMADEWEFLTWFASNCDFGPADEDVWQQMRLSYTKETGKPVPLAWRGE